MTLCPHCEQDPCELLTERDALRRLSYATPVSDDAHERQQETIERARHVVERLERLHEGGKT